VLERTTAGSDGDATTTTATATALGPLPNGIVAITMFVAVSITDTVFAR
jgi:hypothetical protein